MHDMHIAYDLGNSLATSDDAFHGDYGEVDNAAKKCWWYDEGEKSTRSSANAKMPLDLKI